VKNLFSANRLGGVGDRRRSWVPRSEQTTYY